MPATRKRPRVEKKDGEVWVVVEDFEPGWTARFRVLVGFAAAGLDVIDEVRIERTPLRFPLAVSGKSTGEHTFGLTSRILRKVPIALVPRADLDAFRPLTIEELGHLRSEDAKAGVGRRPLPESELALVAKTYVEALRDPHTASNPARAVAERLGLPRPTVRSRIHDARNKGLLTPARWGRPGGSLTKKARELLKRRSRKKGGKK